jgi:hypothetical protein
MRRIRDLLTKFACTRGFHQFPKDRQIALSGLPVGFHPFLADGYIAPTRGAGKEWWHPCREKAEPPYRRESIRLLCRRQRLKDTWDTPPYRRESVSFAAGDG